MMNRPKLPTYKWGLLFVTALLSLQPLISQSSNVIDSASFYWLENNYPIQPLVAKTQVLIDSDGDLSITQLLDAESPFIFQPLNPDSTAFAGGQTVWLKLNVYPKLDIKDWWLVVKRNNSDYAYVAANEYVEVYYVQEGEVVGNARTGLFVPASEKEISWPNSINRVFASFEKDQAVVLYVRIRDHSSIHTLLELRAPTFPILKPDKGMFEGTDAYSYISLAIGIYVFCFFFYTRDESYILLFGLLACLFLHYQILDPYFPIIDWFFPENPMLVQLAWIILTTLSFVFFLEFGRKFANIKQVSPFWNKVMQVFSQILLVVLAIRVAVWFFFPTAVFQSSTWATIPIFLGGLLIVLRLAFFKDTLVRNFVFGAGWLFTFSILGILWENNVIYFFSFINPWQLAQGGFIFIYAFGLSRKIQLSERARLEVEKLSEIDSIKSKFFANISHEFRTPLSLILGPINQSLESIPISDELRENVEIPVKGKYLKVMKRNALRLKNLVDQILDLSKLDQGKLVLEMQTGDIIQFIRAIVFSFESLADRKHIRLRTHFPPPIEQAVFDPDKLEKMISNLLSNAFKFTPEHGEVGVQIEDTGEELKIRVADTGRGMTKDDAAQIFDRFYQVEGTHDQGSGIGLSLVKELVELHKGQISVDTVEGQGTTFKLIIPYLKSSFQSYDMISWAKDLVEPSIGQQELILETEELPHETTLAKDTPLLLIVEDNPDLRQYISDQLKSSYRILLAKDGQEGQQLAEQYLPDLIISDLMMPHRNGLELCEQLKKNVKTSHITFILLTAKADQADRIKGLRTGADDYLTKPFDGRELQLRVKNSLEQQERWREKLAKQLPFLPVADLGMSSMEEQFVQGVIAEIEQNIDNEYFSVEDLASAVGFSRSQLSRKLKSLTDKTPNQLIREIRLTRAQKLLQQKVATVSEIAFQVGYSNLSYFSKSYKEAFGVSPSEVVGR